MNMLCPKCESNEITPLSATYPRSYECRKCGNVFIQNPKTFVDE